MDEGLRQVGLATRLGVSAAAVRTWEADEATPEVRLMARVIAFLGFDPNPAEASLPSRLRAYRRREGITQREVTARLGVSVDTATRWEWRGQRPQPECWPTIERVLGSAGPAPYLHDGRAADLRAVLVDENRGDRHGGTSMLGPSELSDLTAFLLAIDGGPDLMRPTPTAIPPEVAAPGEPSLRLARRGAWLHLRWLPVDDAEAYVVARGALGEGSLGRQRPDPFAPAGSGPPRPPRRVSVDCP